MKLEQKLFGTEDLENLSAIVMYGFDPSQPFKNDMGRMSPIRISSFSQDFSYLEGYTKKQDRYQEIMKEIKENLARQQQEKMEEERQKRIEEANQRFMDSMTSHKSKPLSSAFLFGLGPGVAKETEFGYIERYLPPHKDEAHGEHINLGSYFPGSKKPFLNIHIDLNDGKNED